MKKNHLKIIAAVLLVSTLAITLPRPARADYWGASQGAAIMKQMMEEAYTKIKESIVSSLKMAAIRVIQSRLTSLLGKSSGSSSLGLNGMIIGDWRQFIYGTANNYSTKITNNFFTNMESGASSMVRSRIITPAKNAVSSISYDPSDTSNILKPNLQNYITEGKAENMFTTGYASQPWKVWQVAAEPQNDFSTIYNQASTAKRIAYEQETAKQIAEGVAGGGVKSKEASSSGRGAYTATSSTGGKVTVPAGSNYTGAQQITTPGSVIKDMIGEVQSMPTKMIAMARSIPEIAASMVTSMLTQMINQGISTATSKIQSATSSIK
jgi:hypothetical protein